MVMNDNMHQQEDDQSYNEEEQLLHASPSERSLQTKRTTLFQEIAQLLGLVSSTPYQQLPPAQRFSKWFTHEFEQECPEFFQGSYNQALALSASSGKPIFLYLHSRHHDDTRQFCTKVLLRADFSTFIAQHLIPIVFDVSDSDGTALSHALSVTSFPFVGLLQRVGSATAVVGRVDGLGEPGEYLGYFRKAMERVGREREREENPPVHVANRRILQEQDEEYEQALRRDREMAQERARQEEMERVRVEKETRRQRELENAQEEKAREREESLKRVPAEPAEDCEAVTIQFRLPDGKKTVRRFSPLDTFEACMDFVGSFEMKDLDGIEITDWELVSNYPKRVFSDPTICIREHLSGQCVLFVRECLSK